MNSFICVLGIELTIILNTYNRKFRYPTLKPSQKFLTLNTITLWTELLVLNASTSNTSDINQQWPFLKSNYRL